MSFSENEPRLLHPLASILLTLLIVLLGFQIVGPILGLIIALPFYEGSVFDLSQAIAAPLDHPELKVVLFIMQGCGTLFGLIVIPAILLKRQNRAVGDFFKESFYAQMALLVFGLVIVFMMVNSIFIEWNQNLEFPKFLSGFESWAKSTEEKLAELTMFLTKFDTVGQFILAFIVIAVLPAIGEEIVFRGMIQNDFYRATRNAHISIWMSAILFSAIHLQFYGFIPRMLLGALFGYLYYWSGNLLMPILAHFVNNGFTVVAMYFYQKGAIDIDIESQESMPWPVVALGLILTILLLVIFKRFYQNRGQTSQLQ